MSDDIEVREPGKLRKTAANLFAGVIIGTARIVYGIARAFFMFLESLV